MFKTDITDMFPGLKIYLKFMSMRFTIRTYTVVIHLNDLKVGKC